ncbi:efflux RND transporter periplasmic adaptor subunit [Arenimonas caeni]|uniref:Efflux RND transporter periplasmic adaptor subunit n=1 Tax=Arenimonas caeni TaxID=2058085 RepID=A0A2P6MCX6_9GAMM|nr:efflux RND transporter periplasmic adaptor subunit [Arenimonas caeni]PRH83821.1 efflux RND transporter periplasmic adaptor subunit [Arenimonas caeni]
MPAARSRLPRNLAIAAVAGLLALAAWWLLAGGQGDAGAGFRTAKIDRGDVAVVISATGTLRATTTVDVGSQVSGQVQEVLVDFNDRVSRGQEIARLDPAPLQTRLQQAEADLASARASVNEARATLKNAEADFARKSDLLARQLIARSEADLALAARDQARARVVSAEASVLQRQAAVNNARLDVEYTVIRSPVDGVVLLRDIEPGQTVAASFQTPVLFQIAEDLSQMQIDLSVDEADVGQIREGLAVTFTVDAFPDRQFRGEVRQVRLAATATANVISYPVVVQVQNPDQSLLPGMTASAEIVVSQRQGVLRVPNVALRFQPPEGTAPAAPAGGGGMMQDLPALAAGLGLAPNQQAAFDAAMATMRERAEARAAAMRSAAASGAPAGATGNGGAAPSPEAMRARMQEAFQRTFAEFRDSLDERQRSDWDAGLKAMASARRGTLWTVSGGKLAPVPVRLGVSDGTLTEVSGIDEGAEVVTGQERRPQ